MSSIIPKEKLSAYQRWELASFGEEQQQAPVPSSAEIEQQAAAELALLRENASRQGYAEGYEQGRAEGLAAGRTQAARDLECLREVVTAFGNEMAQANEAVAADLLNLGLDLSKAMLKTALAIRPELVLPIVSEAIRYLPSVQQPALLFLNPEDAAIVRNHMADELAKSGWQITEDPQMERGGCRVETATNQIDAATPGRWQRIAEALGNQSDWLA